MRAGHLVGEEVRAADVADLAGRTSRRAPERLVDRRVAGRGSGAGRGRCSRCAAGAASASMASRMCLRELPWSHGRGPSRPTHLVATMKRRAGPASQRPTISSVRPTCSSDAAERVDVGGVEERDAGVVGARRGSRATSPRRTGGRRSSCPGRAATPAGRCGRGVRAP